MASTRTLRGPAGDVEFDPLDPDVIRDPFPAYARLRERDPVHWHDDLRSWLLARYEDCRRVLHDSDLFAADFRRVGETTPRELLSLQTLDPPEQTPLRVFALDAVRTQDLGALERELTRIAHERLAELAGRGEFDFVADFADAFTLAAICRFLGVDVPEQGEDWARLNADLDRSMHSAVAPDSAEPGLAARASFNALVEQWIAGAGDGTGVLDAVVRHPDAGRFDHTVLVNSVRAFWHAGFEVPNRFLGNAVWALLRDGGLGGLRAAGSAGLPVAVEELVRFAGPVQALSRACTSECTIGDRTLDRGDVVVVLLAAANRDPAVFDRPDELLLDRRPNPHLGFGRGAHSCLGVNVARIEARAVLSALLGHAPGLELAGEPVPYPVATIHGLASLPVRARG